MSPGQKRRLSRSIPHDNGELCAPLEQVDLVAGTGLGTKPNKLSVENKTVEACEEEMRCEVAELANRVAGGRYVALENSSCVPGGLNRCGPGVIRGGAADGDPVAADVITLFKNKLGATLQDKTPQGPTHPFVRYLAVSHESFRPRDKSCDELLFLRGEPPGENIAA